MKRWLYILFFLPFALAFKAYGQEQLHTEIKGYKVPAIIYNGDTIPHITLRLVYVYPELKFKNKRQERYYYKLVRDVKKTLPLAKEVRNAVIETYEYLETLPDEEAKQKHIKAVEKGLKKQYTPRMKKLTFSQGKLLIKLVDRECNQSSFQLVRAFMGPFKAGFYQTFAALFGASLKKEYRPDDEDKMIERVATLVENGQL
ncbi:MULTISPECIES: DUF4294 domain-containing protein [Bacteroides]|uniref:DUF4294 domain-containing protein n=1 Tax=Bacteroides gallinaceum TaxID=1462571 RepID=A0ABT7VEQ3_9BACE|nr:MULTISPECIES: DUF4294 domain-containing protein [Bacteroides]MBW9200257.1 DUF4294 domain-containing protein [Bacteroidales bacterium SW299]MCR8919312.1 DUF4294 domain-containing protein [Bacteroides sp. ET225]MDM8324777.1 DUF4294 domain-containing protein [Bacteroides gallinaceum]